MATLPQSIRSQPAGPMFISVRRAAVELSVTPQTVRNYIRRGLIEAVNFGRTVRIPVASLEQRKATKVAA